jgi:hypothetical protein
MIGGEDAGRLAIGRITRGLIVAPLQLIIV